MYTELRYKLTENPLKAGRLSMTYSSEMSDTMNNKRAGFLMPLTHDRKSSQYHYCCPLQQVGDRSAEAGENSVVDMQVRNAER